MNYYELPPSLTGEIDLYATQIDQFIKGELDPVAFKGIRVSHGLYEQRKFGTYMMRIRCAAGGLTPAQLRRVAELSIQYGAAEVHVTTRQEVQLHYLDINDVIPVYRKLAEVGLSSRGGGGNTVRNIMSSWDSGVSCEETIDVAPYAVELTTRMIEEPDSWQLPRKFKIAFSNDERDLINASVTCLGFIARIQDGVEGFKVFCAGGTGAKPMPGRELIDFVEADKVYAVTKAMKNMFDKHGNRRKRTQAKLKFLWEKLGAAEFISLFDQYYREVLADSSLKALNLPAIKDEAALKEGYLAQEPKSSAGFAIWRKRHVSQQKQQGLSQVRIPLRLGDIANDEAIILADLMENFGDNCMRCSTDQNIHLRNIPESYLGNIYNVVSRFHAISHGPEFIGDMVCCTGADTCKLGICLPRPCSIQLQHVLLESDLDLDALAGLKLHMSGCPNGCGRHFIGDLGFFGRTGRKDAKMYPAYNVVVGADISAEGSTFAEKVDYLPAKDLPTFVYDFLSDYLAARDEFATYSDYLEGRGKAFIAEQCQKLQAAVPSFEENPSYFHDWDSSDDFSLLKGQKAECAASVFDMIDVDAKKVKQCSEALQNAATGELVYDTGFAASRMLLITRGVEAGSDAEIFASFEREFIDTALIAEEHRALVKALVQSIANGQESLSVCAQQAIALGRAVIELHASMDDSLTFNLPKVEPAVAAAESETAPNADVSKDFKGVGCPINFVKTKLALATMQAGQLLEIIIDDREPIANVPRSCMAEGHEIVSQRQLESGHWSVLIRKDGAK